jgi:hypothetical protein
MGYATCISPCACCGRAFSYNPIAVPSIRVRGVKQPICEDCMTTANVQRVAAGLAPLPIRPDAYEACDEAELPIYDD